MRIVAGRNCEGLAQRAYNFINSQAVDARSQMSDMTLHIGLASDPQFKVPAHARDAIYVGDSAHIGNLIASTQMKASFAKDQNSVVLNPKWNSQTGKWDEVARQAFVGDAAPDYLAAQAIAPWAQSTFKDVFERPLLYSHASDLVKLDDVSVTIGDAVYATSTGSLTVTSSGNTAINAVVKEFDPDTGLHLIYLDGQF